jgi:hypothetical protein
MISDVKERAMRRGLMLMAGLLLTAEAALAAPEEDQARIAAIGERFKVFDKTAETGWETVFPAPMVRTAAAGGADAVQFDLKPGSYMIVALCQCEQMDVTLVGPDASEHPPLRSNDQGAMYAVDVTAAGTFLTGVDMGSCTAKSCDFAVKVWRKK